MAARTDQIVLLTRHFFRRFLDNDLISPQGDLHENASAVFAVLAVPGLLVSVPLLFKYLSPIQSPAERMLLALDDKFLYLTCSMIVMALVTLIEWDALGLDARDLAILGPLPVERRSLVGAKLGALALLVAAFGVAVNALPSVLYPVLVLGNLPISPVRLLWLTAVHAASSVAAGAFAFLALLALRELLRGLLGDRMFRRASLMVQFVLVLALLTALLLAPGPSSDLSRNVLTTRGPALYLPPMWFLGLYETLSAGAILGAPGVEVPAKGAFWTAEAERRARSVYLGHEEVFHALALTALGALAAAFLVALLLYLAASRRRAGDLGEPLVAGASRGGGLHRAMAFVARRAIVRDPVSLAAFFFTLQTLLRSAKTRLHVAGYLAVGFALVIVTLTSFFTQAGRFALAAPWPPLLSVQSVLLFFLLLGLRAAFAVPVELEANWVFRLTERGRAQRYATGVRRAVFVAVGFALLLALLPFHVLLWGWRVAAVHLACGSLLALILSETMFFRCDKMPFTCSYAAGKSNLKVRWPLYLLGYYGVSQVFVALEHFSLQDPDRLGTFVGVLIALLVGLVLARLWRDRRPSALVFDEPPDVAVQTLELSG